MNSLHCEIAVLGSGFGGTLLAIIAQRLGFATALVERGSHPRFAIGESSTPLADFKLATIADRFGLDWLRPFARYGSWKTAYPHVGCGRNAASASSATSTAGPTRRISRMTTRCSSPPAQPTIAPTRTGSARISMPIW